MSMDSIPMRKRSRKPKHVYNAADVAPLQAPWKASTFKPKKVHRLLMQMVCIPKFCCIQISCPPGSKILRHISHLSAWSLYLARKRKVAEPG